jgi:uncharacterized membrane protein YgcG
MGFWKRLFGLEPKRSKRAKPEILPPTLGTMEWPEATFNAVPKKPANDDVGMSGRVRKPYVEPIHSPHYNPILDHGVSHKDGSHSWGGHSDHGSSGSDGGGGSD